MRHQFLLAALIAESFAGGQSPARAQLSDRVIPIPEITEEAVARIDLQDGTVAEWWDILGEPALTITDFEKTTGGAGGDLAYDPSDLDFVMWLGWRQLTNHLYVAVTATDDRYVNEFGADVEHGDQEFAWDIFAIAIDGDHSGGQWVDPAWWDSDDSYKTLFNVHVQEYVGMAQSHTGRNLVLEITHQFSEWMTSPPYGEGGGGLFGENPLVAVIEFYVTAFDHLDWESPDNSEVSQLFPGKIIGLRPIVVDRDGGITESAFYEAAAPIGSEMWTFAESFLDAVLIGADGTGGGGTAVKPDSWARIKASLAE